MFAILLSYFRLFFDRMFFNMHVLPYGVIKNELMATFITYLLTPVFVRQLIQYLPKQTPQFELEPVVAA